MFLLWKSIYLKLDLKKFIFFASVIILGLFLFSLITKNCSFDHLIILSDIQSVENSFDPEFCEYTVEKIEMFNDKCESEIEILDCS